MVRLDRIVTRTGDTGMTSLGNGERLPKDHPRIAAIGAVDEANCVLGLLRLETLPPDIAAEVARIQNDLFDLGADLATPPGTPYEAKIPRLTEVYLARLEQVVVVANAGLAPFTSFTLPGGSRASAWLHLARTVVRRAERDLVAALHADNTINPVCLRYLNRLSDLCFVWSRVCNDQGRADVAWVPGQGASESPAG
jgi:cob(I)alamin adenosyltransferase